MAWNTPRTWSVADVVTAAEMNAVRDDLREIWRLVQEVSTTSPNNVGATTAATAATLLTFSSFTADGVSPVYLEFNAPELDLGNSFTINFDYWDGSTDRGIFGTFTGGATMQLPVQIRTRTFVPSNAAHTFSIRAWVNSPSMNIAAGAGGAGTTEPMFARLWSKGGA